MIFLFFLLFKYSLVYFFLLTESAPRPLFDSVYISVFKIMDKLYSPGCNVFIRSICDRLWHATSINLDFFLLFSKKYLANATFGTNLAFQMSVLERLEKVRNLHCGPLLPIKWKWNIMFLTTSVHFCAKKLKMVENEFCINVDKKNICRKK